MNNEPKKTKVNKKYLKIGSFSMVMTAVVLAAVILLNLFVAEIPSTYTKYDLSSLQLYSISEETEQILAGVDEDINVYILTQRGAELANTVELLGRYEALNSHVHVSTVDPLSNPNFVSNYTDKSLSDNSVIVESAKRSMAIDYSEIYPRQYSEEELYYYYYYGQMPTGTPYFNGELMFTTAIDYVTRDDLPTMYSLTGHGETALGPTYSEYITSENVAAAELSLLTVDVIPADCSSILINNPTSDLSVTDVDMLKSYLDEGGNIILVTGAGTYSEAAMPNLAELTAYMGMESVDGIVVETNRNNYMGYPHYLLPNVNTTAMDGPVTLMSSTDHRLLMNAAHGILPDGTKDVIPLLATSADAYVKVNLTSDTLDKADDDIEGMVYVGAAVTGEASGARSDSYKFVWYSSPAISDENADMYVSGGNSDLFISTVNWMSANKTNLSIIAKQMQVEALTVTGADVAIWSPVVVFVIPLAFLVWGFVIWFKRRKK
ncbi:MAG: Gldg family protein [Clostridia bacterium]|nr:Gldg family protein [Clostridia bacterium]